MLFGALEEARQFYYNYDNKVEFEPHIRNINFDKNGRTPINQSVQCNRDGYRTKKNPAIQRSNIVSFVYYKARIYVKLDKKLGQWRLSKVELAHMYRCDPNLSWMFKKNRKLSMHVKDVIECNDQAEYTLHDNNWLNGMNTHSKLDWVDKVNSSYILSWWSKNVYRKHTHIRSSHDSRCSDESMNIFRGLCVDFYNVAQDFVHDKEEADILRSAFASAKVGLSEHWAKHSESVRTSECPDRLNTLWSPPHVASRGHPSFKRLEADMDWKIKNATKKCRASNKHSKEVAAIEGDKYLNQATKRCITASKHPKDFVPIEEDCFTDNTFSCIPDHFHHATNTQMDSLSSVGFTTLLNSFQNPFIHVRFFPRRTFYLYIKLYSFILC
ncbi:hypothetical protein Ahy_A07g036486 [Arachis hypogaea]|uniref:FAR1 domain-containing protein n=1 Tax=Arachis hypogaea TaxID=3818 RepID=A0A445CGC6_ARAHY|nr:hypothetical protein Ahy_A07g036486 [Arachis hypogaea]